MITRLLPENLQIAHTETRQEAAPSSLMLARQSRATAIAGALLLVAGFAILMGIITAEAEYPAVYTTHENEISDLGATRPPDSIIRQPSARIFNATMLGTGVLILAGAYFLHRAFGTRRATISVGLLGLGVLGVGIFPGNYGTLHPIFAMLAFVSGGLAGLLAAKVLHDPFRRFSQALGIISLTSLVIGVLGDATPLWDELGDGGVERWVAYPVVLWLVASGGYLLAQHRPGDTAEGARAAQDA